MATSTMSSKGQIVVPKSLRDELDWPAGAKLKIEKTEKGLSVERIEEFPPKSIDEVLGMFKLDRPITDEEIETSLRRAVRNRWRLKE